MHIPESRNTKQPADWPDLIDEHARKDWHIIEWNKVKILEHKRLVKEALYIDYLITDLYTVYLERHSSGADKIY